MSRTDRPASELKDQLEDQLQFLRRSAEAYDAGHESEYKRLALVTRILCHDTGASRSVLSQLGQISSVRFHDLSLPYDPSNQLSHSGLVRLAVGFGGPAKPLPMLDHSPTPSRRVSFHEWWHGIVFADHDGVTFDRSDLVLTASNQDGGAHVDSTLNAEYYRLTRENTLGWYDQIDDKVLPSQDQVPAAIRHIAYEVLLTLKPEYADRPADPEGHGVITCGAAVHSGDHAPSPPVENLRKTGRNELCPCGSGKKYKHCCLHTRR